MEDSPDVSEPTDLERLEAALADLRAKGYVAQAALAETSSAGWDEVATMSDEDPPRAVFWNMQSQEDSLDDGGMLVEDLPLQWSGDADAIAGAFEAQGFAVTRPGSSRDTIVVHPQGGASAPLPGEAGGYDIDVFHEVMGGAGWRSQWNDMLVEYVREGEPELRVRADPDVDVLILDLAEGGDVVKTREIPFGNRFREAVQAVTAVPDDVTAATFEAAIEPVVAAAG